MIGGISKDYHWIADYGYVPFVLTAPLTLKFRDEKFPSTTCYVLASAVLTYALLTDAKWGLVKLIPYKTHAVLDIVQGSVAIAAAVTSPSKTSKVARSTLIAIGVVSLVVGTLSYIGAKKAM